MDERSRAFRWRLLRRREFLVPTWRGWLLLLIAMALAGVVFVREANSFLSVTDSKPGGVLVVEGWAPDYALKRAVAEYKAHAYSRMYVTGGPIEYGALLVNYKTYAELGVARLLKLGMSTNEVQAVPAPFVAQDRTYTSAVALRRWFASHSLAPATINLLTEGPHARRSRLLFHEAFGTKVAVGIIAVPCEDYDPVRWWSSSQGVRKVIGEGLAYVYARFFFWPPRAP